MIAVVAAGWAALAVGQLALWWEQQRSRDASLVDVGWSVGLVALAVLYALAGDGVPARRGLVAAMVAIWGGRLAWHLGSRIRRDRRERGGPREDGRYAALRARWGARAPIGFLGFFQVQAAWSVLFSIPILVAMGGARPVGVPELVGGLIWLTGVVGEAVADRQLARFRARPGSRGRTCRDGLWRTSRHPNYFFEWITWWSYPVIAWGAPHGWVAFAGPAVMLLFLWKVTGIPYTEAQALRSRGADYRAYQQTTSAFVPWWPRPAPTELPDA